MYATLEEANLTVVWDVPTAYNIVTLWADELGQVTEKDGPLPEIVKEACKFIQYSRIYGTDLRQSRSFGMG